ncbi:DNA-deoxyinosine glycosylase [Rheinheimera fenheensis]|uniref:DNA-deoxyinosine glycosylase n=1 Tax=Rheinheimera fenheensis TaxID=3152295 RepID=UPI00325F7751
MTPLLTGLAPVAGPGARVLILGSMPGTASLAQQQYYAHPRNAFWPLMAQLLGFSASLPYEERISALQTGGVTLWDVIASCQRSGSLDSAIQHEQLNDFSDFFASQPDLRLIAFNGAKAWHSFKRHILPLNILPAGVALLSMPSTSPAHASLNFQQKLLEWQKLSAFLSN